MTTAAPTSSGTEAATTTRQTPTEGSRVVVGVDGSESSKIALRWAEFLARATGSTLEVVAAWQPFTGIGWMGAGMVPMPPDWNPALDAEKSVMKTIDEVFGEKRPAGLELLVSEGNAAQILLEASRDARLLVVGSRGHGGFAGLLLGSISAACSEHATCPVVVVHGDTPPPE